jgi:exopolysaccharide biosynthesis protein
MLKIQTFLFKTSFTTSVVAIALATITQYILLDPSYAEQGKTIQLNGQPWIGAWIKTDSTIYLQDNWLSGAMGVELMDSDRPKEQRLRWFSSPMFAAVTYDQPVQRRFLDIKSIAKDWRTEVVGEILRINTPTVAIAAIRRSRQVINLKSTTPQNFAQNNIEDRLVINLDRPTPWQMQRQNNLISLAIAADLAPDLKELNKLINKTANTKGSLIQNIDIQTQNKQTLIKIQTTQPLTPDIQTLSEPNRIIINLKANYQPPDLAIAWAKGLIRKQQIITLKDADKSLAFSVSSLIVNLKEPSISMRPIWSNPDGMVGTSSLRAIAEQWQAAGAINGGFFNRDRKMPVGAIRESKRWMAGGVLNRGTVAWNESNVFMDRLSFGEEIVTSQGNIALTHLNSGFVQNGLARYTSNWGATYTPLTDNEVILVVVGDRITAQFKAGANSEGQITIPDNGYLLVGRKAPEIIAKLPIGEQIKGITNVKPETFNDFSNVLGAGPLLLKNGNVVLDASLERFLPPFDTRGASRSAIATTQISGQVLLTTIQATRSGTLPSLKQTAEILKKMGAINALNLDGGGSTTLYLGGAILNRSLENVSPIHNAIGIFINLGQK